METVQILFPRALNQSFTYKVPEGLNRPELGQFVGASFGREKLIGVIWSYNLPAMLPPKLKSYAKVIDIPPLSENTRRFLNWVAEYYMAPLGNVLKMAMSVDKAITWQPMCKKISLAENPPAFKKTEARQKLLTFLEHQKEALYPDILAEADVSASIVKGLIDQGVLTLTETPLNLYAAASYTYASVPLTPAQQKAYTCIKTDLDQNHFHVSLLDGVTGSGKTEVYFEAIAHAMTQGKQSLVLMPEIALTTQWLSRFESRFGIPPLLWHSSLSEKVRRENWRKIIGGQAPIVVGARSALMLPFSALGLIIVDEEHEPSYKQEEGVRYHARDAAIMRGKIDTCPVVLASATPSLESLQNVASGRYSLLTLPERHGGATMPQITLIDMSKSQKKNKGFISEPLRQAILETLDRQEQVLLFLNRRGYAPLTLCQHCGFRHQCISCSSWLVYHQKKNMLVCHHCGFGQIFDPKCPSCESDDGMITFGPGVERIEEESRKAFPGARIGIMSSDHQKNWKDTQTLISSIENRELDILIGTQMATKGHHFKHLTLVGVIDGDSGISGPDPRAAERSYQLLHQVSGRAGREQLQGHVYIQTFSPNNPLMQALVSGKREDFIEIETENRADWNLPPFGRLASLIITSKDMNEANQLAAHLAQTAPQLQDVSVLGPAQAPLFFLQNHYRFRLLLKMSKQQSLQKYLETWLDGIKTRGKVTIDIDVDPQSFM